MSRLSSLLLPLLLAATPVAAAPAPIDQSSWTARKQHVRLPNGLDMAYVELGSPRGRPVVLLHGYTDTSRLWTIVAPYLAEHRLLIPDQRGHGDTSKPECCYAPADFAYDLKLFLDALRVPGATVVGSSMGSMVAQLFAAEYPDRVRAIVLAGSTALPPLQRDHWLWPAVTNLQMPANRNAAFLKDWSPSASPTPVDATFVRHFDAEMTAIPATVWRSVIRELAGYPVGRHAADVKVPVLILSGGKDPIFPAEQLAALLKAYPSSEAHVFPDLGHNLVVERPEQGGPVLARFLAAH